MAFDNIPVGNLYAFNIVLEAKVRAMVVLTRKHHPEFSKEEIEQFLKNAIEYACKKEL